MIELLNAIEAIVGPTEMVFAFNLLLCLACGYIIGAERESRGKSAGIATQCLVMAGAMAFCFLSVRMEAASPTRIAANVVTGIGFLGAGIIFHHNQSRVYNLTTAATIWISAAIGMAFGFGYPLIGLSIMLFTLVAVNIPQVTEHRKGLGRT